MGLQIVLLVAFYISFAQVASGADYKHLGCFKDTFIRAITKKLTDVKSVEQCAKIVRRNGYSTFGVQYQRECYSDANAANTYKKHGVATNCRNGMGGEWANDVYQLNEGTYIRLGCWEDKLSPRAMPTLLGRGFSRDVIVRTCADHTRAKGWSVFGVQANNECWGGADAGKTYSKYSNKSGECASDGTGASLRNEVYRLPAQKCMKCNGKDNCTKITCSNTEPYCYKVSYSQENKDGAAASRVTLGGCMSSCTSSGKSDLCVGKKNCYASCCSYENCNDPNAVDDLPKCYACNSTKSASDCEANQYVIPCSKIEGAQSFCYTAQKNGRYWKDCHEGDKFKCDIDGGLMCGDKAGCSMTCCIGFKCNGAINVAVSVFLIMACALMNLMF